MSRPAKPTALEAATAAAESWSRARALNADTRRTLATAMDRLVETQGRLVRQMAFPDVTPEYRAEKAGELGISLDRMKALLAGWRDALDAEVAATASADTAAATLQREQKEADAKRQARMRADAERDALAAETAERRARDEATAATLERAARRTPAEEEADLAALDAKAAFGKARSLADAARDPEARHWPASL